MRAALVALVALASCGGRREPDAYLEEFTDTYCAVWMECADPAQLAFDGVDVEDCVATNGARFEAQWQGCKLDSKAADRCLTFLAGTQCPADGGDLDAILPLDCSTAWEKCAP